MVSNYGCSYCQRLAVLLLSCLITIFSLARADNVPLLKEGVQSNSYKLEKLGEFYSSHINFDPIGKFFILRGSDGITRIDAQGKVTATVNIESDDFYRIPFSPFFIVENTHLYDFTEPTVSPAYFVPGERFNPILEEGGFGLLYDRAEAIAFGEHRHWEFKSEEYVKSQSILTFIKLDDLWSVVSISPNSLEFTYDKYFGYDITDAPQKPERMIMLKDVKRGIYSHNEDMSIRSNVYAFPEQQFKYAQSPSIRTKSYSTEYVSDTLAYINIPSQVAGHAVHEIKIGTDVLLFKEIAKRSLLSLRLDTQMNFYVLPELIAKDVPVSFVEFDSTSNVLTSGSDGLYVLRPK